MVGHAFCGKSLKIDTIGHGSHVVILKHAGFLSVSNSSGNDWLGARRPFSAWSNI